MSLEIDDDCPARRPDAPAVCRDCDINPSTIRDRIMAARTSCPVAMCMWHLGKVSTFPTPDDTAEVPPWCLPTWEIESGGYGSCLTAAQVVAAHVATHPVAERAGRMPSRAEVSHPEPAPPPEPTRTCPSRMRRPTELEMDYEH